MSENKVIIPTIGRRVWYWPSPGDITPSTGAIGMVAVDVKQPFDAGIVFAHNERFVNLVVTDHVGYVHTRGSVELWQGDMDRPSSAFCEWMPYQKGQAAKPDDIKALVATALGELLNPGAIEPMPAPEPITTKQAFDHLKSAMAGDPEYAWGWQCNLAMPILDAIGVSHEKANEAGARLMRHIFGVDMTLHPHYKSLAAQWAEEAKTPPPRGRAEWAAHMERAVAETDRVGDLTFGRAIALLKAGKRVARLGWNGKGMFVYYVPAASYPVQTGAAKEHFGEGAMVPYNAYFALKTVEGSVSTWVPSINDCLAEDWVVVL